MSVINQARIRIGMNVGTVVELLLDSKFAASHCFSQIDGVELMSAIINHLERRIAVAVDECSS